MELNSNRTKTKDKMKHTMTELQLCAGINDGEEAYLCDVALGEFIHVKICTLGTESFSFELHNNKQEHVGQLDFSREQAYFLHSWLNTLLFDGCSPISKRKTKK